MDKEKEQDQLRKDILNRLRRIEGQVKGIHGMVDKNVCCDDILIQVAAIRSAINKVGGLLIENYAINCLDIEKNGENEEQLKKLIKTINSFVK